MKVTVQAEMPMSWDIWEASLLALTLWREARGESTTARIGVAYSVINRVRNPKWWGNSIASVLAKRYQYSALTLGGDPNLVKWPVPGGPDGIAFEECMKITDQVLSGVVANPVTGADSYYDASIPPPAWAKPAMLVKKLGRISFYNVDGDTGD
jgi:N-acetylmuramoyl-L-alanine amidase